MRKFIFVIIGLALTGGLVAPTLAASTSTVTDTAPVDTYLTGTVVKISNETTNAEFGDTILVQHLLVTLQGGREDGKEVPVEYQVRGSDFGGQRLAVGERVVVDKNETGGVTTYLITEPYRLPAFAIFALLFVLLTVALARWRGFMAFVGLGLTAVILFLFVIPQIAHGANPFLVSFVATLLMASSSLFLAHGFNLRTTIAFAAIMITIVLALVLATILVTLAHLTGIGSEEAATLLSAPTSGTINLRGLLLGGIIIGVLGVLDDVATAQVAAVAELKIANPRLNFGQLYRRGSVVGREHITSLVNTLVLAYVGASFPLLLLFSVYSTPWWVTMNTELITEEIARTLVGSLALVAAVPIATVLAAYIFHRRPEPHH